MGFRLVKLNFSHLQNFSRFYHKILKSIYTDRAGSLEYVYRIAMQNNE